MRMIMKDFICFKLNQFTYTKTLVDQEWSAGQVHMVNVDVDDPWLIVIDYPY